MSQTADRTPAEIASLNGGVELAEGVGLCWSHAPDPESIEA